MTPERLAEIFSEPGFSGGSFACETNLADYWSEWKSRFVNLNAAGGLVLRDDGFFLGMYRLGMWDLPKGKAEKGETMEITAVREVEEECGIRGVRIEKPLMNTYHVYPLKGRFVLKKTYWFLMNWHGAGELTPQTEEGIEALRWFAPDEAKTFCANTYQSVAEVVGAV
jgi:8-oxo-dGTP pyrophosphatase MutT (NUDIX family)